MALTANREVDRYVDQELRTVPVKGSTKIYKGALVGLTSGHARGLVAGDAFAGIAYSSCAPADRKTRCAAPSSTTPY